MVASSIVVVVMAVLTLGVEDMALYGWHSQQKLCNFEPVDI
jgi:hypothetical protein